MHHEIDLSKCLSHANSAPKVPLFFFVFAVIVQAASLPITRVHTLSLEDTLSLRVGTRLSSLVMDSSRAPMGSHLSKAHLLPTLPKETAHMGSLSTASRVHHRVITTSQVTTVRVHPIYFCSD